VGYLKGRFCSLRGLRQQIDGTLGHERAIAWIKTCLVIHTLVSKIEHGSEDANFVQELIEEGSEGPTDQNDVIAEAAREVRGQTLREKLKADLFKYLEETIDIY